MQIVILDNPNSNNAPNFHFLSIRLILLLHHQKKDVFDSNFGKLSISL